MNEGVQPVLGTLPNIEQLKSEKDECIGHFISGKYVVALLHTGLFTEKDLVFSRLHTFQYVF